MKSRQRSTAPATRPHRSHRLQQLPSPTEQQLQQRESGWNDRFFCEPPANAGRGGGAARPERPAAAPAANSPKASQLKKENRIRDERLQYGDSAVKRKAKKESKQPASGRLVPLGILPEPAVELQLQHPNKEEKLRLKALRAIESRENALYQLNALVLCTPIQEALFQPSRPADPPSASASSAGFQRMRAKASMALAPSASSHSGGGGGAGVMTNAREATKMAQKLAEDLQLAGIQCVEAIVEWMLEAGAKAEKPPPFLWRDRNYFLKMNSDLDFAQSELEARGVYLECYRRQNPLLIRTSQKLGRVLAAQAIIAEMVALASASSRSVHEPVDHGFEKRDDGAADDHASEQPEDAVADFDKLEIRSIKSEGSGDMVLAASREEPSADEMIVQNAEDETQEVEEGEQDPGRDELGSDHEQDACESDDDDDDDATAAVATPPRPDLDASSAEELVGILDESLNDLASLARQQHSRLPQGSKLNQLLELTARHEGSAAVSARTASEYDDGFDEDTEGGGDDGTREENQDSHDTAAEPSSTITRPPDSDEDAGKELANEALLPERDAITHEAQEEGLVVHESPDNQSSEVDSGEPAILDYDPVVDDLAPEPTPENPFDLLLAELSRLSRESGSEITDTISVSLLVCASWKNESRLVSSLEHRESLDAALEGSFYAALAAFELSPALKQTEELLLTSAAKATQLDRRLWRECACIADSVYAHVATKIELALESGNSLVSEIEVDEVLELTEGVLLEVDRASWSHVRTAIEFLKLLRSLEAPGDQRAAHDRRTSPGVSRLVKVFYPYLVNLPREKLAASWRRIARAFATTSPRLNDLEFLMDPTCKTLLLAAVSGGSGRSADESEDESVAFPKLTIVCERGNVLETSAAAVWSKVFATKSVQRFRFVLYPFFGSSFGEKTVDGVRVEEGEGRGPLKEWIALVSSEMAAKWTDVAVDASLTAENAVQVNDNKLTAAGLARLVHAGYEVSWQSSDAEQSVVRVANSVVDDDTVLLDRGVVTRQSFPISELRVRRPRSSFLEHIKASESFWLNAQTLDSPENRRVLRFYGWYLAAAVAHYTAIDMPVHLLFFRLLLDETHRVSLEDVRSLDSTLYGSLVAMKRMPASDFQAFLELEGADASLSVDAYIERAIDEQFGAESNIGWQMRELRSGFHSVFSSDDLSAASIEPDDLAAVICGSASSAAASRDADFSVDEIFRAALDPDFVKCVPLRRAFWRVVNAFDPQLKRKFVKFVTGVDTLPLPDTEFMRIEMPFAALTAAENKKILQMLPQSHTCDNTLELPNYWRALCWKTKHAEDEESEALEQELTALLDKKLRDAVEYSSGYGLDATSAVSGILSARRRPTSSASRRGGSSRGFVNDESYESLDLPAMVDLSDSIEVAAPALQVSSPADPGDADGVDEATTNAANSNMASRAEAEEEPLDQRPPSATAQDESEAEEGGDTVPEIATSSPTKSARRHDVTEESYGDDDFEDEMLS